LAKKDVLIRGLDDAIYRRAKALAASKGITVGNAVDQALASWTKETDGATGLEAEIDRNREFVRANWKKIRQHRGKAVVISERRLQGVFPTYEEARSFALKKRKVALVFVVGRPPMEREIELGDLKMEVLQSPLASMADVNSARLSNSATG
jgi:hypothetical protein